MHHPRHSTIVKVCGVLLLLLGVSPVTAPFSVWDPGVLYHDTKTQMAGAAQIKPASDDPVISPDGCLTAFVPHEQWLRARAPQAQPPLPRPARHRPLRI